MEEKELTYGDLQVHVLPSFEEVGARTAADFAAAVNAALAEQDEVAAILSTGNSQLSFFRALAARDDVPWDRVVLFHADEYLGMPTAHSASLHGTMLRGIVEELQPKAFYGIQGDTEPIEEELARYTSLLEKHRPTICAMGIGENGHLGFNDPPADFESPNLINVVPLDEACRMQQVGEGHFPSLEDTPSWGLSLSIPALVAPPTVLVIVPEQRKAQAVRDALEGPVTPMCPASILQNTPQAQLYLDTEAASLLTGVAAAS